MATERVTQWRVPCVYADDGELPYVIDELHDEDGQYLYELEPTKEYDTWEKIIEAMNERAEFVLWRNRQALEKMFGPFVPGMWRGQPNKYAVKCRA